MRLVASGKTQRFCDEGRNGATSLQLSDATAQPHEGSSMDLKNARTAKQGSAKISVNLQAKTGHKVASYAWVYFRSLRYTASPHIKVGRRSWWAGGRPKGIATRKRRPVLLDIFRLNPSSKSSRAVVGRGERSGGALCCAAPEPEAHSSRLCLGAASKLLVADPLARRRDELHHLRRRLRCRNCHSCQAASPRISAGTVSRFESVHAEDGDVLLFLV